MACNMTSSMEEQSMHLDRDNESSPAPRPALLYGASAIAGYLGMSEREVRHQIEATGLPVIRMGQRRLAARPERLVQWLDELERKTG
jgi:hypothetical protein